MKKSLLISFEGIEGSGKSTQIETLKRSLNSLGVEVHLFREPGGTMLGEKVRKILLDKSLEIDPLAELNLFISSRIELLKTKILPLYESAQKSIIILDRFRESSIAYQGAGRGLGVETVKHLHSIAPLNVEPDFIFYLDIPVETSRQRVTKRNIPKDKMELLNSDFFEKVRAQYLETSKEKENMIIIDATKSINEIQSEILDILKDEIN